MSNWPITTLGRVCKKIGSGSTPRGGRDSYKVSGIPLIRSQNVLDFAFSEDGLAFIDGKQAKQLDNVIVKPDDVLINITGDSIARVCKAPVEYLPARVNQHVSIIRADPDKADPNFLLYYLQYQKPHLLSLGSSGGTRNALTKQMLEDLPIPLTPLSIQHAIGCTLASLDAKIASNKKINHHLEQMAQAVFRHWFVENGEVDGWDLVPLPEIVEVNPSRTLKKGEVAPYLDMANMPTKGHRGIEWVDRPFGSGTKFTNGDTLLARITPCLENGKTAFVDFLDDNQIGWGSTEYIVFRPKPPLPPEYGYLLARGSELRNHAIVNMTGTSGRQRTPGSCFNNFFVSVPPDELAKNFGEFIRPLFAMIRAYDTESRSLAIMRDSLLPKLMSGELSVADVDAK